MVPRLNQRDKALDEKSIEKNASPSRFAARQIHQLHPCSRLLLALISFRSCHKPLVFPLQIHNSLAPSVLPQTFVLPVIVNILRIFKHARAHSSVTSSSSFLAYLCLPLLHASRLTDYASTQRPLFHASHNKHQASASSRLSSDTRRARTTPKHTWRT